MYYKNTQAGKGNFPQPTEAFCPKGSRGLEFRVQDLGIRVEGLGFKEGGV